MALGNSSGFDLLGAPIGNKEFCEEYASKRVAKIKAAWLARARRNILVCDFSKWNTAAAVVFAPWSAFTDFVTDRRPPKNFLPRKLSIHLA